MGWIIAVFVIGILLIIQYFKENRLRKDLLQVGVEVKGKLLDGILPGSQKIVYEFQGRTYKISFSSYSRWKIITDRNSIPIVLDPSNPKRALFDVTKNELKLVSDDFVTYFFNDYRPQDTHFSLSQEEFAKEKKIIEVISEKLNLWTQNPDFSNTDLGLVTLADAKKYLQKAVWLTEVENSSGQEVCPTVIGLSKSKYQSMSFDKDDSGCFSGRFSFVDDQGTVRELFLEGLSMEKVLEITEQYYKQSSNGILKFFNRDLVKFIIQDQRP